MWVPVAVWQPCELLYICYLLTYNLTTAAVSLWLSTHMYSTVCMRHHAARVSLRWLILVKFMLKESRSVVVDRLLFPTVLSWHLWQFLLSTNDDSTRNSSPGLRAFVTFVCYFTATAVQGKCCGPLEMEYCIRHLKQQVHCCKWLKEILKRS